MKGPASGPPEQTSASVLCARRGGRLSAGQGVAGAALVSTPDARAPPPTATTRNVAHAAVG